MSQTVQRTPMPAEFTDKIKIVHAGTKNPSVGQLVLEVAPGYTIWASHTIKMPDGTLVKKRLYPSRKYNTMNIFVAKAREQTANTDNTNSGARVFRPYQRQ